MKEYIVNKLNNSNLASTNCIYLKSYEYEYVKVQNGNRWIIFKVCLDETIDMETICLNNLQRNYLCVTLGSKVKIESIEMEKNPKKIDSVIFVVKNISSKINPLINITDEIIDDIRINLDGISVTNDMGLSYKNKMILYPIDICEINCNKIIGIETEIKLITTDKSIQIELSKSNELFNGNFDFNSMGIGGLDKQFEIIFRRAFSSRLIPEKVLKNLGINHVRGIMLYGAPGCGKTLIARQIGKILNCEEPKIVSGPSLLSSYQGQSEKNVRDLFENAFADKQGKKLHLIILDEFDAISRKRGTIGDSGLSDRLVNQFLSMIDGPESLNNVLLIAMTNRLELIDEALLRPGRFEVQIEIGLPDEKGRNDILKIHTNKMRDAGYLDNVNLEEIAAMAVNFTGAELESVVKNAVSYCISKEIDPNNLVGLKEIKPKIMQWDLIKSVEEIKPQFGSISKEIEIITSKEYELYSKEYREIYLDVLERINNLKMGNVLTILIQGDSYVGKTTMACQIAKNSGLNCIKFINSEKLLGNVMKETQLYDIFQQGIKSDSFIMILDCVEKIIEYSKLGNIYSNKILQTIYSILTKIIDSNKKIVIILTSSNSYLMNQLELDSISNYSYNLEDNMINNSQKISEYFKEKKFI